MKKLLAFVTIATLLCFGAFGLAQAATQNCEAQAVDKNGKPLAGAAKNSFMKKCTGATSAPAPQSDCEGKAIDKNGKPLHGAAKAASIKKCTQDAQGK